MRMNCEKRAPETLFGSDRAAGVILPLVALGFGIRLGILSLGKTVCWNGIEDEVKN